MQIAVVIPTLDESHRITATLDSVLAGAADAELDLVVVDGGSRDGTPQLARERGARVLHARPGRARQLQAGLDASAGDCVVFLHADTRLPDGWVSSVRAALADPRCVGGAFGFGFAEERPGATGRARTRWMLRAIECAAGLRSRWLQLPYGDQAPFARRAALEAIGGVPQAAWMEDLDLVARLRRQGRLRVLPERVRTSPRRYLEHGLWRTVGGHGVAVVGWALGAPRASLQRWLGR